MGAEELFVYHHFLVAFDIVGATINNLPTLQNEGLPVSGRTPKKPEGHHLGQEFPPE
jgi:hypothetical protein